MNSQLIQLWFVLYICSHKTQVSGFGAEFLCGRIPGLTAKQREICQKAPDSVAAIGEGRRIGLSECQDQFRSSRWNCSVIDSPIGHVAVIGSREASFLYAVSSAGVTYAIAQGCARGNISACGCAPPTTVSTGASKSGPTVLQSPGMWEPNSSAKNGIHEQWTIASWRWGGCSTDITFATKLARIFLDSREVEQDARSFMNLHNNKAGRKAVQSTLETQCKCHGLSGSCTLKTCWLRLAPFKRIGDLLLDKYKSAHHVYAVKSKVTSRSHPGKHRKKKMQLYIKPNRPRFKGQRQHSSRSQEFATLRSKMKRKARRIRPRQTSLVYLEQSPNYCEADSLKAVLGTKSRQCKRSSDGSANNQDEGSCEILCCGRGYSTHEILKKWKCQCKFSWCCTVECQECQQLVEVYTCN